MSYDPSKLGMDRIIEGQQISIREQEEARVAQEREYRAQRKAAKKAEAAAREAAKIAKAAARKAAQKEEAVRKAEKIVEAAARKAEKILKAQGIVAVTTSEMVPSPPLIDGTTSDGGYKSLEIFIAVLIGLAAWFGISYYGVTEMPHLGYWPIGIGLVAGVVGLWLLLDPLKIVIVWIMWLLVLGMTGVLLYLIGQGLVTSGVQ